MRISDWSSDVCSSDLRHPRARAISACGALPVCESPPSMRTSLQATTSLDSVGSVAASRSASPEAPPSGAAVVVVCANVMRATVPLPPSLNITGRSEEHTSELQSLMRISYAVFCLKKNNNKKLSVTYYNNTYTCDSKQQNKNTI